MYQKINIKTIHVCRRQPNTILRRFNATVIVYTAPGAEQKIIVFAEKVKTIIHIATKTSLNLMQYSFLRRTCAIICVGIKIC